jgi:hypothetical protein
MGVILLQSCSRSERRAAQATVVSAELKRQDRTGEVVQASAELKRQDRKVDAAGSRLAEAVPDSGAVSAERTVTFSWKPTKGSARQYAMSDPEDQHRILLTRGVHAGNDYPVVVALHGQPRRGQAPRSYAFPRVVAEVTRQLVESNRIEPLILVTPVFRFEGQNWPGFELAEFMPEVRRILSDLGLSIKATYAVGHSGAAGCGGGGLNRASDASLNAVGFFDTCVGAGFLQEVKALEENRTPTLIIHSVETAGFQPRQPVEYDSHFDFGQVYSTIGLHRSSCPERLPAAPLRDLDFRCATNDAGTTWALVVNTGQGEQAHEALVPVALRYFLQEYLAKGPLSL